MEQKTMDTRTALDQSAQLPFAYVRSLSRVYLGENPGPVTLDGLIEARFFSENEEIRLFSRQGEWCAAHLIGEEKDEIMRERYCLSNPMFGKELTVIRHLAEDEDGQMYVLATRLAGWKGDKNNG